MWNLNDWEVSLFKEGYEFKQIKENDPYNFKFIKLSHLRVLFSDADTNKPLLDVIVSISGPENYRLSDVTNAEGTTTVIGLVKVLSLY